jgi:50S ribosomal protein L16 3-hydroxylase
MKKTSTRVPHETLLGGLHSGRFLKEYWQKKPLLIRGAMPGFSGLLNPEELAGLACEEDVQSRLVLHDGAAWQLEQGPFEEARFAQLPQTNWTLLVQNVNHYLPEAAELLQLFNFVPYARLDDLMVSYAPDGGGVGPHFDSYDVFLLQGQGKRLWRVSEQKDLSLIENAPLRILRHFNTEQEWLLEPGDMLYLPPHMAHWGIAVGDCMTYSIGFRAPAAQELAVNFLAYLQEHLHLTDMYADPDLKLQKHPAKISTAMVKQVTEMLNKVRWQKGDVARFLGSYLSEPKTHVLFDQPRRLSLSTFERRLHQHGIGLSLQSSMLFHGHCCYVNGEAFEMTEATEAALKRLADRRCLEPQMEVAAPLVAQLHQWYLAGYCRFPD